MEHGVLIAFLRTLFAGLSTGMGSFFLGFLITALIDKLIPTYKNSHEARSSHDLNLLKAEDVSPDSLDYSSLMRTGVFTTKRKIF